MVISSDATEEWEQVRIAVRDWRHSPTAVTSTVQITVTSERRIPWEQYHKRQESGLREREIYLTSLRWKGSLLHCDEVN